jgi:hypothetical protein
MSLQKLLTLGLGIYRSKYEAQPQSYPEAATRPRKQDTEAVRDNPGRVRANQGYPEWSVRDLQEGERLVRESASRPRPYEASRSR